MEPILEAARVAAGDVRRRAAADGLPLYVGGVSLGTFSAVHVAKGAEDVRGVVLSAPPSSLAAAARHRFAWLPIGLLLRHPFDSLSVAEEVAAPVLVLHGDLDRIVPQQHGRDLAARLPRGEFVPATGHGHMIPLHRGGPFGERIEAFFEALR